MEEDHTLRRKVSFKEFNQFYAGCIIQSHLLFCVGHEHEIPQKRVAHLL